MNRIPMFAWLVVTAVFDRARVCAYVSRVLLLLVAIEVVTMPITQHLWTWDKFLHGGQDFELGLLAIVTCLCFVILRTQHSRQSLGLLLAIGSFLLRMLRSGEGCGGRLVCGRFSSAAEPMPYRNASAFGSLPLLI